MLNASKFRDLVSGRRRGVIAACMRMGLRLAELPYSWAMRWRNRRYDRRQAEIRRVEVPVVSVGNLSMGGTGKTPLVEWIARYFRADGVRISIVSRGYGAEQGERNDEALELELALPDVPHLQNPNRVEAAEIAVEELSTQMILLDDGFQHRRLARDLDIVLLDATEPFGHGHVFPRGMLREPVTGLARADVVVLSRADVLAPEGRRQVRDRVISIAPDCVWCEVVHEPEVLINSEGEEQPVSALSERRVAAFCGIGNPRGFRHTLESLGCDPVGWKEFPDHHSYSRLDVDDLRAWAVDADLVVCTRKDLVKLGVSRLGNVPLWAVGVKVSFLAGQTELESTLSELRPTRD